MDTWRQLALEYDFYEVLGCEPDASLLEIKKAYRDLVLLHHPDKVRSPASTSFFMTLQVAWNVLRDVALRAQYDVVRQSQEDECVTAEKIEIGNLEKRDGAYIFRCRCGDTINIDQDSLDAGFTLFDCESCSLQIDLVS